MTINNEPHAAVQAALHKLRVHAHEHDPDTRTELLSAVEAINEYTLRAAKECRVAASMLIDATQERARFRRAALEVEGEVETILAPALGYPAYKPGEPGYHPDRTNYVTGDHTGITLAMEAATTLLQQQYLNAKIKQFMERNANLRKQLEQLNVRQVSRLLFLAREYIEMLADIVEVRGKSGQQVRDFVTEIDDFRRKQGWNVHGFGNE